MGDSEEGDTAPAQAYMAGGAQGRREQETGHEGLGKAGGRAMVASARGERVWQATVWTRRGSVSGDLGG